MLFFPLSPLDCKHLLKKKKKGNLGNLERWVWGDNHYLYYIILSVCWLLRSWRWNLLSLLRSEAWAPWLQACKHFLFHHYSGGSRRGTIKSLLPLNAFMLFTLHASEHPKAANERLKTVCVYIYIHIHTHVYIYMHTFICIMHVFFLSVVSFR